VMQRSYVFKSSELFHRRVEYFKRHVQDKIMRTMPCPGDFSNSDSSRRKTFKWMKETDLVQLKVL
jgi:hypothetical protein